ncbi:transcriptional regulator GutM [Ligilactobacillus agilis]|uniref:transcriptional regulator GutM n=2 Tax=Ligilactobacillus agilis TaxID=1601 RepID=UPI0021E6FEDB|nr:transcriptional regulator GutM [Ligilactobacillus agilis]
MLIAIDDDGNIKEARLMQGVTVFAKFKQVPELKGQNIALLAADYQALNKLNKLTRQCLLNAYKTFIDFKTQKLSKSAYDTSKNVFTMPLFTKITMVINNLKATLSRN